MHRKTIFCFNAKGDENQNSVRIVGERTGIYILGMFHHFLGDVSVVYYVGYIRYTILYFGILPSKRLLSKL